MKGVSVISHPLVQHHLTQLRDRSTRPDAFRRLLQEVATLMAYEATRDLAVRRLRVRTPLESTQGFRLKQSVLLVPVLRAGLGMLEPMLRRIPGASVGFIGLQRNERTLSAERYHASLPRTLRRRVVLLIDPMLATGGSAVAALEQLEARGAADIRLVNLVAAPEGIRRVRRHSPATRIFTASIDRALNERGFILPGLGEAGDRLFGEHPRG